MNRRRRSAAGPEIEPGQTSFIPDDEMPPAADGLAAAADGDPQWAYVVVNEATGDLLACYRTLAGSAAAAPLLAAARGSLCDVVPVRAYSADEPPDVDATVAGIPP